MKMNVNELWKKCKLPTECTDYGLPLSHHINFSSLTCWLWVLHLCNLEFKKIPKSSSIYLISICLSKDWSWFRPYSHCLDYLMIWQTGFHKSVKQECNNITYLFIDTCNKTWWNHQNDNIFFFKLSLKILTTPLQNL